jgi:hypothetical protein
MFKSTNGSRLTLYSVTSPITLTFQVGRSNSMFGAPHTTWIEAVLAVQCRYLRSTSTEAPGVFSFVGHPTFKLKLRIAASERQGTIFEYGSLLGLMSLKLLSLILARRSWFRFKVSVFFFFFWRDNLQWVRASLFTRFLDHTQRRTTVGRIPLHEWSARRRDLYLTTNTTLTIDKRPCPRWNSNPQSQQASGRRPTP